MARARETGGSRSEHLPRFRRGAYYKLGDIVLEVKHTSRGSNYRSVKLKILNPPRQMRRSRNFVVVDLPHGDVSAGVIDGRREAFAAWLSQTSGCSMPRYPLVYCWDEDGAWQGRTIRCDVRALQPISKREAEDFSRATSPRPRPRKAAK